MITRSRQTTSRTLMPPLAESLFYSCSADTCLTRAGWVYFYQKTPGALSLVRQLIDKATPSRVVHLLRKVHAGQPAHIQIFNSNQTKVVDNRPAQFVVEVRALILHTAVDTPERLRGSLSTSAVSLSPRNLPRCYAELSLGVLVVTRILNRATIRKGRKRNDTSINTRGRATRWQRSRFTFDRKKSEPFISLALDGQGFNRPVYRAMQFDPDATDLHQPEPSSIQRLSDLSEGEAVVTAIGSESRIARLLAGLYTAKESIKRQVNTLQGIREYVKTDYRYILTNFFYGHKLSRLIEIGNQAPFVPPSIASLLKRSVIQFTAYRKLIIKNSLLPSSWVDTVSEGFHQDGLILPQESTGKETQG